MKKSNNILITGASSSLGEILINKIRLSNTNLFCQYKTSLDIDQNSLNVKKIFKVDFCDTDSENKIKIFFNNYIDSLDTIIHLPANKLEIKNFNKYTWSDFEKQINIQVKSLHLILQNSLKLLKKSANPKIVLIGSDGLQKPIPKGMASYLSVKGMLYYYYLTIENELKQLGIKTIFLNPKMFKSPLLDKVPEYIIEKHTLNNKSEQDLIVDQIIDFIF